MEEHSPPSALVKPEELEGTADDDRYFNSCFFALLLLHIFNSCYCPVVGEGPSNISIAVGWLGGAEGNGRKVAVHAQTRPCLVGGPDQRLDL